jgi:hypothetical protein
MKNAAFWDVMLCGSCKNWHFGGTYRLHHQDENNQGYVLPKCQFSEEPHGITSQKKAFCNVLQCLKHDKCMLHDARDVSGYFQKLGEAVGFMTNCTRNWIWFTHLSDKIQHKWLHTSKADYFVTQETVYMQMRWYSIQLPYSTFGSTIYTRNIQLLCNHWFTKCYNWL